MGDLFNIKGIKQARSQSLIPTQDNGIPYVVQSTTNNMVSRNVNRQWLVENNEPPISGNVIVLGVTLPAVSYQPYEFGASQVITASADFVTEEIGLYFVSLLKKQMARFSYSKKPGINIYKALQITLPINESGDIDFAFMQARIQEMEQARIQEMEQARIQEMDAYLKVAGFEDCELTEDEKDALLRFKNAGIKYSHFKIGDLFEKVTIGMRKKLNKSTDVSKECTLEYNIPVVNAKHGNNGIMYYGRESDFETAEMTIDIVNDGAISTGDVYAQPQKTGVLYNAYLIKQKQCELTLESLLYFATAIGKAIKRKYGYNNKATWEKVKNNLIDIPVADSNSVDYHFMETYIRAQEKLAIQRVKDWRSKEISATRGIVEPGQQSVKSVRFNLRIDADVDDVKKFSTHLPVYSLRAVCGYFDNAGKLQPDDAEGWVDICGKLQTLNKGMFVVFAEGTSMEPKIHNGDLCVFDLTGGGSHDGDIVLVKAMDKSDPNASCYTIKTYHSKKVIDDDGVWRHSQIILSPINKDFNPIIIDSDNVEEGEFKVYGRLVTVLRPD